MPWSNSRVYWDAGNSGTSSYDRVDQAANLEDFSENKMKLAGEGINNLKKLFNINNGWKRSDDSLPERLLKNSNQESQIISKNFLDSMINNYYHFREWDNNGNIPKNKLEALNII